MTYTHLTPNELVMIEAYFHQETPVAIVAKQLKRGRQTIYNVYNFLKCGGTALEQNGDIVIAMTAEDEATCKRFYKKKNFFRLQPENDLLEPIILDQVSILGRVVGLYPIAGLKRENSMFYIYRCKENENQMVIRKNVENRHSKEIFLSVKKIQIFVY
ncbi:hypothetical protein EfmJHP35_14050 [Enterococcus faecium]|nr:hypothetical protein EfmJHP35_14050 [Enterococcus faecium]